MSALINAMSIMVFLMFIMGLIFFMRWKYQRDLAPTKEYPHGKLVVEIWTPAGPRIRHVLPILPNGFEVRAPAGSTNPRYFFDKKSVGRTKYPLNPILPFPGIQVDADIVSWYQNNPEPIPATKAATMIEGKVVTSELMDLSRDTDTLGMAQAANEEMAKTQQQLAQALQNKLDKKWVYIGLAVAALGTIICAVLTFQMFTVIQKQFGG